MFRPGNPLQKHCFGFAKKLSGMQGILALRWNKNNQTYHSEKLNQLLLCISPPSLHLALAGKQRWKSWEKK